MDEQVTILIVDDDETNLFLLAAMARRVPGVHVLMAQSGLEALSILKEHDCALVLLDVMMPGMDGFETAEHIRTGERNQDVPLIFVTAVNTSERHVFKGYETGAVDYLFKPVVTETLCAKIRIFVELYQKRLALTRALEASRQQTTYTDALLEAARMVLHSVDFPTAARKIFDLCRNLIGATSGFVGLMSASGEENEILFFENGEQQCDVDPTLPFPIRGLRAHAYTQLRATYENNYEQSQWASELPAGHIALNNVLFAPLLFNNMPVGIIGLANKPDDFTDKDAGLTTAFGDFIAMSLRNSELLESLRTSKRDLSRAEAAAHLGSFVVDPSTQQTLWSDGLFSLFGLEAGDVDMSVNGLINLIDDPYKDSVRRLFEIAREKGVGGQAEFSIQFDSDQLRHFVLIIDVESTSSGSRIIVTCQDITERKSMERSLVASQKLDAVGHLAGGVAHEINTPIQYVFNNINFLQRSFTQLVDYINQPQNMAQDDKPRALQQAMTEIPSALNDIRDGMTRVSTIVTALQQLTPKKRDVRRPVDINDLIRNIITLSEGTWREHTQVELELEENIPEVICSSPEISQAILNIFINAVQAVSGMHDVQSGCIRVCTRKNRERVEIHVMDNGPGIPPEAADFIFNPFFTTKDVGVGVGQGLSLAYNIIQSHNGTIDFTTDLHTGTNFIISLPLIEGQEQNEQDVAHKKEND
ncbi:response regulator [Desulfovibrio inopinatus]|uniref:response regulator n=1 Tax=Desulfovibrio inopinatus TaxID=102109 RepID=UPI0003FD83AB|nr:response regulator [Desulfovibrio inopinatus]